MNLSQPTSGYEVAMLITRQISSGRPPSSPPGIVIPNQEGLHLLPQYLPPDSDCWRTTTAVAAFSQNAGEPEGDGLPGCLG